MESMLSRSFLFVSVASPLVEPEDTHLLRKGSITVQLTSSLDPAALFTLYQIQIYKFGWIQSSQTGGQPYTYTSPYEVSECSLAEWSHLTPEIRNVNQVIGKFYFFSNCFERGK